MPSPVNGSREPRASPTRITPPWRGGSSGRRGDPARGPGPRGACPRGAVRRRRECGDGAVEVAGEIGLRPHALGGGDDQARVHRPRRPGSGSSTRAGRGRSPRAGRAPTPSAYGMSASRRSPMRADEAEARATTDARPSAPTTSRRRSRRARRRVSTPTPVTRPPRRCR